MKVCSFKMFLDYRIEKLFYEVYYDAKLSREQVEVLDARELRIIQNFILAKYNYQFADKFYQAYFNTFDFYGSAEKRRVRLDNIEKILTDVDRNNIKLINTVIKAKQR